MYVYTSVRTILVDSWVWATEYIEKCVCFTCADTTSWESLHSDLCHTHGHARFVIVPKKKKIIREICFFFRRDVQKTIN